MRYWVLYTHIAPFKPQSWSKSYISIRQTIASASYGLPDLGIVGLEDVLIDVRRITSRVDTPLLVDVDARFGGAKWSFCD